MIDVGRSICLGNALNMTHPLNRGLTFHWLCLPGITGGIKVADLGKKTSLTRSLRAGSNRPLWAGSINRPGGRGSLRFQGTGDIVSFSVASTTTYTYSLWIFPTTTTAYQSLLHPASGDTGFFFRGDQLKIGYYQAGTKLANTALTLSTWNHVGYSLDSGSGTFYLNGRADGTFTGINGQTFTSTGADSASENYTGYLDDARLYVGRVLTAMEWKSLYDESRRGYPNLLNRSAPFKLPMTGTAAAPGGAGGGSIFQGRAFGRGRILGGSALVC